MTCFAVRLLLSPCDGFTLLLGRPTYDLLCFREIFLPFDLLFFSLNFFQIPCELSRYMVLLFFDGFLNVRFQVLLLPCFMWPQPVWQVADDDVVIGLMVTVSRLHCYCFLRNSGLSPMAICDLLHLGSIVCCQCYPLTRVLSGLGLQVRK